MRASPFKRVPRCLGILESSFGSTGLVFSGSEIVYTSAEPRGPSSIEFLRKVASERFGVDLGQGGTRRIYVSRNDGFGRHIHNEDEVMAYLEPLGFEKLFLGSLSIRDQMKVFAEAEFIVGPHGAGLINGIFSPPGTRVLEMFSPNMMVPTLYYPLAHASLEYGFLTGEKNYAITEG